MCRKITLIAGVHGVGKTSLLGILRGEHANGLGEVIETTLEEPGLLEEIKVAAERGYYIKLYYIELNNAEESIKRLERRAAKSGQSIEPDTVINCFDKRFERLAEVLPYCSEVVFFNNENGFELINEEKMMEKKWSHEKNFVVEGHEQVETFANAIEVCINNPRKKRDVDVVRLRGRKDIQKFIKRRFINSKMKEVKGINECKKQKLVDEYVEEHKLYESKPSIGINLKELSRYCRENGVDTTTLDMEKIAHLMWRIKEENKMSNLSEAIMEEALKKIIIKTLENGKTAEEIAEFNDVDIEVVRAIEAEMKKGNTYE